MTNEGLVHKTRSQLRAAVLLICSAGRYLLGAIGDLTSLGALAASLVSEYQAWKAAVAIANRN